MFWQRTFRTKEKLAWYWFMGQLHFGSDSGAEWCSWQSSCFQHQKTPVWIPPSAKFKLYFFRSPAPFWTKQPILDLFYFAPSNPGFDSPRSQKFSKDLGKNNSMLQRFIDGPDLNSDQRLDNVNWTHLVLASSKLVLQKSLRPQHGKKLIDRKSRHFGHQ